ncbi:MAG: PorV/PorQ family protein [Bacteroidota bacterium]
MNAQTVAKYAGEFMAIGVGGRALGLGSAYVALANDATAGYWNPAALARLDYPEVMLMHDERFGSLLNYDFGSVGIPYGTDASLGITILRLGVDGIPDTRNAWLDANGNGRFDDDNRPDYNKITYFSSADWALYLTYAQRSSEDFSYGINVKLIRRNIAEFTATGVGFDLGLLYSPAPDLYVGLNAQDITTTFLAWSTGTNELITPTLKLGTAYFFELFDGRFAPVFDVDIRFENRKFASVANVGPISLDPHLGLEFDFKKTVALRVGYNDIKQLTLGAGLHLRKLDVDYSFARFGRENNLGDTHRISLRLMLQAEQYARAKE